MNRPELPATVLFIDYSSIYETAKGMDKWIAFNLVLENLRRFLGPIAAYVYLRNGHEKSSEFFANIGVEVITCLANCDFLMGYDISEVIRTLDPSTVIIASHDGGLRQIADRIERAGRRVIFLAFPESRALSSFLRSKMVVDIEELALEEPPEHLAEEMSGTSSNLSGEPLTEANSGSIAQAQPETAILGYRLPSSR